MISPDVIVGIQARMSSSRLPGKVMMDIGGKPMIHRVYDACVGLWHRVVLTTRRQSDDVLCEYLRGIEVDYRRGSLVDVLSRYSELARIERPGCLVRVCGDAPFLDAAWINRAAVYVLFKKQPIYIPGALHAGTSENWREAGESMNPHDIEHAGDAWFAEHGLRLDLVPDDYFTVNTLEELERARLRVTL